MSAPRRQARTRLAVLCLLAVAGGWPPAGVAQAARVAPPVAAQPATATRAAPSASTPVPAALQGRWEPLSRALAGLGALTLAAEGVQWSICGAAPHAVVAAQDRAAPTDAPPPAHAALLAPAGPPGCVLDGIRLSHLRLVQAANQPCELEVSLYENAAALAQGERLAWGVLQRSGCQAPAGA